MEARQALQQPTLVVTVTTCIPLVVVVVLVGLADHLADMNLAVLAARAKQTTLQAPRLITLVVAVVHTIWGSATRRLPEVLVVVDQLIKMERTA